MKPATERTEFLCIHIRELNKLLLVANRTVTIGGFAVPFRSTKEVGISVACIRVEAACAKHIKNRCLAAEGVINNFAGGRRIGDGFAYDRSVRFATRARGGAGSRRTRAHARAADDAAPRSRHWSRVKPVRAESAQRLARNAPTATAIGSAQTYQRLYHLEVVSLVTIEPSGGVLMGEKPDPVVITPLCSRETRTSELCANHLFDVSFRYIAQAVGDDE